jgi:bifunctional non-homologous end joining protein LigD
MSRIPDKVETSREDKVFFPEAGLTKGNLIDYYRRIAETMLPHVRDRPVVMRRFPNGIAGKSFVQQEAPDYFPAWIERVRVDKKTGGKIEHVLCQNQAALVYLADQACITPHVWLSRRDRLGHPDQMIFDLDPPDDDFGLVRRAAGRLREVLDELGLQVFAKTTGGRGLHLLVPLDRQTDFEAVRKFAQDVATLTAARDQEKLTTEQRKDKRRGRLFLDTGRNAYGQTAVAPYAVRAKPGAPVATPLASGELSDSKLDSQRYTIRNIFKRLGRKADPWAGIERIMQSLPQQRLADLAKDKG